MAYKFTDDNGHAKIGGTPSDEEKQLGQAIEDRQLGKAEEWIPEDEWQAIQQGGN